MFCSCRRDTHDQDFHARYNKPLWLTEVGPLNKGRLVLNDQTACHDYSTGQVCTEDQVKAFMKTAIGWFEGEGSSIVERWAWFGAFPDSASGGNTNGLENTDGTVGDENCAQDANVSRTRWANTTSVSDLRDKGLPTHFETWTIVELDLFACLYIYHAPPRLAGPFALCKQCALDIIHACRYTYTGCLPLPSTASS